MALFGRSRKNETHIIEEEETLAPYTAEDSAREVIAAENERQAAVQEAQDLRDRYELMITASNIGLWDMTVEAGDPVNPDNEFWWSDHFRAMLGFTDENDFPNVLNSWASRLHPDDADGVLAAFGEHLNDYSGRTPYDIEYRLQMKSGEYRWFRASGATKRDASGVPLRVAGALHDIHDTKNLVSRSEETANRLRETSSSLSDVSRDMAEASHRASEAVHGAAERMNKLDESSTRIAQVVSLITKIAQQTNLLALNATIEAARAGEYGKGFAVVADEVKDLSNETSRATSAIAEHVETIQSDAQGTVAAMAEVKEIMSSLDEYQRSISEVVQEQQEAAHL